MGKRRRADGACGIARRSITGILFRRRVLTSPLIMCPLRFEAAVLRRELTFPGESPNLWCSGPGSRSLARWADAMPAHRIPPIGAPVLLMGLAGSLSESHRAGTAYIVDQIRSASGETMIPPLRCGSDVATIITSTEQVVASRDERLALAQRTGAHLVDLESVAFAQLATARGWRWGVIRGVSDDLSTLAPAGMERWVDERGRTRKFAVLAALARKPSMVRDARCLHHNSKRALARAAELITHMR